MRSRLSEHSTRAGGLLLICGLLYLLPITNISAQTLYTVVLGNQNFVVGSSTLRSGLFVSYDTARTWKHVGPENLKAYAMDAVDSSNGRILFIAAGNGVHRSTDYGRNWKIVTDWRMTEVLDIHVDQSRPNIIYAATAFGFWRSTDGGESWENPRSTLQHRYCDNIRQDSNQGIVVQSENFQKKLWSTENRGESWTLITDESDSKTDLPLSSPSPDPIHDYVRIRKGDTGMVLAGTYGDGLFLWDGTEWSSAMLPGSQIWSITVKDYTVPEKVGHHH